MKKVYFASDFHLGVDARLTSVEREEQIIRWLDSIKSGAETIYFLGDIFDFWFDYGQVVPRGFIKLLAKIIELKELGVEIVFFTGNHDMWMFDYFEKELGIKVNKEPITINIKGKSFFIGHGDGLGPGDYGYKFIKKVFANGLCQWVFRWIHPDIGMKLAKFWSSKSRGAVNGLEEYCGDDKEWLLVYANEQSNLIDVDFFIFGHRHLTIDKKLKNGKSRYINTGEWLYSNSYAVFDGHSLEIAFFENKNGVLHR